MRRSRGAALTGLAVLIVIGGSGPADAQCERAVVFTLPGITWKDVAEWQPPAILETAERGSIGSLSVRAVATRTSLASGFATIGAGTRVDGAGVSGGAVGLDLHSEGGFLEDVRAAGHAELRAAAAEADYGAVPGELATALGSVEVTAVGNADEGLPPPLPAGFGRWTLLTAMDSSATVDRAAVGVDLLASDATAPFGVRTDARAISAAAKVALSTCGVSVIDHGDLARADQAAQLDPGAGVEYRRTALLAADALWAELDAELDPATLVLLVAPTNPAADPDVHFGIAIARGPGFAAGSVLRSASTHRSGIVTLVDIAPTVLDHFGLARPPTMQGRPMFSVDWDEGNRVAAAIDLDEESVFVDDWRTPVTTGFVVLQVVVYLLGYWWLRRQEIRPLTSGRGARRLLQLGALGLIAFPLSTYVVGFFEADSLGPFGFPALLLGLDAGLVGAASLSARRSLDRLLLLTAATTVVLLADLLTGSGLQLNTVFSYSPIVAGRFFGIGNIAFTVLAASAVLTGALVIHRWKGSRPALVSIAALFVVVVVIDGAPQFGADIGGVLALVPGLGLTWLLLAGRRPTLPAVGVTLVLTAVLLALLLAVDLARPPEARSHLARLFEDVRSGGGQIFLDALERKIKTNLRIFGSTIWTYLVPPALAFMGYLLLRPSGRWQLLADRHPRLRAGLVGSLLIAVLGFAVNDSGIVVPAVILSFLAPAAVLIHLSLEQGELA